MNDWTDEDPPPTRKPYGYYRNSASMCDCDMCTEDPAEDTDLDPEEFN